MANDGPPQIIKINGRNEYPIFQSKNGPQKIITINNNGSEYLSLK